MNLICAAFLFLVALFFALAGVTRAGVWSIERRSPPVGAFAEIDGARIHYVHIPAPAGADLPPVVFIHGASANLKDQMLPLEPLLEGRAEMLFLDRPGFGWSERGDNETLAEQADTIAALPGTKIVLGEPFLLPVGKHKDDYAVEMVEVKKRQAVALRLAAKYHLPIVRYQEALDAACAKAPADHWSWDGVHPTYAGHGLMAEEWLKTVDAFWGGEAAGK